MGLLDEAIREHLELQRRRGADPTEIARAEREALEPVFPGEPPRGGEEELGEGEPTLPVEHAPGDAGEFAPVLAGDPATAHDDGAAGQVRAVDPGFSALGQETAELDMEAYMDGVEGAGAAGVPPHAHELAPPSPEAAEHGTAGPHEAHEPGAAQEPQPAGTISDDMLEWEEPAAAQASPPEQIPGQESLSLE